MAHPFLYLFVHKTGIVFFDIVGHLNDLHCHRPGSHRDLKLISHFHLVAGLYHSAVDTDTTIVASLIGNGAPLDQTGDLQVLV